MKLKAKLIVIAICLVLIMACLYILNRMNNELDTQVTKLEELGVSSNTSENKLPEEENKFISYFYDIEEKGESDADIFADSTVERDFRRKLQLMADAGYYLTKVESTKDTYGAECYITFKLGDEERNFFIGFNFNDAGKIIGYSIYEQDKSY